MIYANNLTFKYPGNDTYTVNNITFEVNKGEILGFLGPSGSGKSTTQKILIGLLKDYKGNAKVFGKEVKQWDQRLYEKIGVSFELPNHYNKMTALENLNFFRSFYSVQTKEPISLLKAVNLEGDKDTFVSQFSKGMKMRLNIARSLINNPNIIFFDEPTSGLDPVNARTVKDLILGLKQDGHTIFLTTHNMTVADELCDRVAFLVDGEIKLIDSPRRLKMEHGQRKVKVEYKSNHLLKKAEFSLNDLGKNKKFLDLLNHTTIETIHTEEATLEDIFIKVTGRELK